MSSINVYYLSSAGGIMLDILREAVIGQVLHLASGSRMLPYPDQRPGFVVPEKYRANRSLRVDEEATGNNSRLANAHTRIFAVNDAMITPTTKNNHDLEDVKVEEDVIETETIDSYILVHWYGPGDPENPRNWSSAKRVFVLFQVSLLTFSVYIGSAIYTASSPYIDTQFRVPDVVSILGLSLFVEGYALGSMIFSPLQELPVLGRNPVYIITLVIFAVLQIPTALSTNIGGLLDLLDLRFLSGFFGRPALATGGASVGDIYLPRYRHFSLGLWAMSTVCGPMLGPSIGGFAAASKGWRWPIWELVWVSGFSTVFLAIFLPETLPGTILLKPAKKLRKLTGNDTLRSMSEIEQAHLSPREIAMESLFRPFQLMLEPAILFINVYIGLAYAVFYLWFQSFPLVFVDIYGSIGGVAGLPFLSLAIGAIISYIFYCFYNILYFFPGFTKRGFDTPPEE